MLRGWTRSFTFSQAAAAMRPCCMTFYAIAGIAVEKAFLYYVFPGSANHDVTARSAVDHDAQIAFNNTLRHQAA